MINTRSRHGNFTSSEIVALLSTCSRSMTPSELAARPKTGKGSKTTTVEDIYSLGTAAITYIEECNMERRLGRSLADESNARPLTWGKMLESRPFDLLGIEYSLNSKETIVHPTILYWSGSPDGFKYDKGKTVIDIKCPMTLKSFCQLVDPLYYGLEGIEAINAVRNGFTDNSGLIHAAHKDGEKFYWQLVSNAILTNSQFAELIPYVPYKSELDEIKLMAQSVDSEMLSKHYWIAMALDGELPYLNDGGYYKNLNTIRFGVPSEDKELLTEKILLAGKMLINPQSVLMAEHKPELKATIVEQIN